ncbi:LacI family DNA-binding transcriptional regulator [Halanaerobium salsuginis]|uniref:Transcriptional regulator, LacI family n=1 Tax=Halanaerobium salsuginis TaxID=29563 RepID=A0A1I4JIQ8_9FIRM|nr:LacI family DNA-binding transcriptional regulator [Halanaerobium salsuginis]SFL66073.1 transcriptional regulator, LacI family [Halanaerobium salsuginis]
MVTIYDIAKKAGVSITTVSRVINNHPYVKDKTRAKVKKLLKATGYVPNSNASSLVSKKTNTIAVILPDITNIFFAKILRSAEERANSKNFTVIYGNTNEDFQREKNYIKTFIEKRIDGLLLDPIATDISIIQPLEQNNIPFVLIDREIKGSQKSHVGIHNEKEAIRIVNYLIKKGKKNIALISASEELSVYKDRKKGYIKALKGSGLELKKDHLKIGTKPIKAVGYNLTKEMLKSSAVPDAIFVANNFLAIGVYNALQDLDFKVPADIAIACFDDFATESIIPPFFTSIIQPASKMGTVAMELLLNKIEGGDSNRKKIYLKSKLSVRRST